MLCWLIRLSYAATAELQSHALQVRKPCGPIVSLSQPVTGCKAGIVLTRRYENGLKNKSIFGLKSSCEGLFGSARIICSEIEHII